MNKGTKLQSFYKENTLDDGNNNTYGSFLIKRCKGYLLRQARLSPI